MAARFMAGENQTALTEAYGCSRQLVVDALRRQGVDAAKVNPPRRTRRIALSDEHESLIIDRYRSGLSVDVVADACGVTPSLVYRVLTEHGVKGIRDHDPRSKYTADQEREMVALYAEGASIAAIARQFDAIEATVNHILDRRGVEKRPAGGRFRAVSNEDVEAAVTAWEAGESQGSIAARMGMSQPIVSRLLRQRGKTRDERRASGSRHGHWKSGRILVDGYVRVYVDPDDPLHPYTDHQGYMAEHRLVMARALGRPLLSSETVHHVNGDTEDNSLGNLQIRQGKHGKGAAFRCLDCGSANVEAVPLGENALT